MYILYMQQHWNIIYYETETGECPVQKFIDSRKEENQAKIFSMLSLLEEKGPTLPRPYADLLTDGIHEIRVKLSGDQIRILYFFCYKNYIVLTHSFTKSTDKVPKPEIKKALKYKADFLNRYSEKKIKELLDEDL